MGTVLWIYWPALHGQWLWDDDKLISRNSLVHDPAGLRTIWFEPENLLDYQPLEVSVVWLEWQLWGKATLGYHLVNVVLHVVSAFLVWTLLRKLEARLAWLGGLLFAIHPIMVESVAWMSELKNTLSLPPFLLAMIFWIEYDDHRRRRDYAWALGLFLAAMLCKATMVMFPVVILLYAWWKRDRIKPSDLRDATPFFGISLVLGLVTFWFNQFHAIGEEIIPMGGILPRLARGGLSLAFYFSKAVLPLGLCPIYPRWTVDPPSLVQFLPWPILGGILYYLWTRRQNWGRHVLLGLGFFLVMLLPFIGFTAGSYMSLSWEMDHILYLPVIGLIGVGVAGLGRMDELIPNSARPFGIGVVTVVMALLAWGSHRYAEKYVDQETLWTYTLQNNPGAYAAYNGLGEVLFRAGRMPEAIEYYEKALRINPQYFIARNNLAATLAQVGRTSEAMQLLEQLVQTNPDYAEAHDNLGNAYLKENLLPKAIEQYRQALLLKPDLPETQNNLGNALAQAGRLSEAIPHYEQSLELDPDNASVQANLGLALAQSGRYPEAITHYEQSLRLNPDNAAARDDLAKLRTLVKGEGAP